MKKIVALVLSLVMVLGLAVTAMAAPVTATLWDLDAEGAWKQVGSTGGDLDDATKGYKDGVLPSYKVGADYFVETTEAAATWKITYGAKTVFLAPVELEDIAFEAKASVLKVVDADDAVCGDWFIADLDDEDVYYASYNKTTGLVDTVYVATKGGDYNVLVGDKLVAVDEATAVDQAEHNWVGYDVVNYAYTTVKCTECGKVATLYANATAAGKYAVEAIDGGWITAAAAGYTAAGAVQAPADTTVESAETFDAGIAMYVGMSVMAAAGSAVVLKKKD